MESEISNHIWQFPPSTLARMLSPKEPKSTVKVAGELLRLNQYNCVVDGPAFQIALDDVFRRLDASQISQGAGTGEVGYYPDLAEFLTSCVEECHEVLDKQKATPRQDRWYQELRFVAGIPSRQISRVATGYLRLARRIAFPGTRRRTNPVIGL